MADTKQEIGDAIACLKEEYDLTIKHDPDIVTGIQISRCRDHRWLKVFQTAFIIDLLTKNQMQDAKGCATPLNKDLLKYVRPSANDVHASDTPPDLVNRKKFQSIQGGLMWLAIHSRPDLLQCVNFFARWMQIARKRELGWIRNAPLRYLAATKDMGTAFYSPSSVSHIQGAADADFAGDLTSSRTTLGGFLKLGECGTIAAWSKLARAVQTSTGHAETSAVAMWCKEEAWTRVMLNDLGIPIGGKSYCLVDNAGVIKQALNPVNHAQAKHYRVDQAYIRERCTDEVHLVKEASADNTADVLTKPLPQPAFTRHRDVLMGPQCCPGCSKEVSKRECSE
jgi:hypothetical protein